MAVMDAATVRRAVVASGDLQLLSDASTASPAVALTLSTSDLAAYLQVSADTISTVTRGQGPAASTARFPR